MNSVILQAVSRIVLYVLLIFSVFLLVRGHNAPGGGFIAGLLAAGSIVLQWLAFDVEYVKKLFPVNFLHLVAAGLLLAVGVGFVPVLLGYPFLTSAFRIYTLPLLGSVEVGSAFFFDVGVFLVVVGSLLTVIEGIARDGCDGPAQIEASQALKEDTELWRL